MNCWKILSLKGGAGVGAEAGVWAWETAEEGVEVLLSLVRAPGGPPTSSSYLPGGELWWGLGQVRGLAIWLKVRTSSSERAGWPIGFGALEIIIASKVTTRLSQRVDAQRERQKSRAMSHDPKNSRIVEKCLINRTSLIEQRG